MIVFVLNAVILLTVMITFLFLLKRKMTYSKHKLYDIIHYIYSTVCALFTAKFTTCRSTANGDHGVVSHMNELYNINGASITKCSPPYEDVEGHWTNSDSVPQDTVEDSDTYGHSNEEMPVLCNEKRDSKVLMYAGVLDFNSCISIMTTGIFSFECP